MLLINKHKIEILISRLCLKNKNYGKKIIDKYPNGKNKIEFQLKTVFFLSFQCEKNFYLTTKSKKARNWILKYYFLINSSIQFMTIFIWQRQGFVAQWKFCRAPVSVTSWSAMLRAGFYRFLSSALTAPSLPLKWKSKFFSNFCRCRSVTNLGAVVALLWCALEQQWRSLG